MLYSALYGAFAAQELAQTLYKKLLSAARVGLDGANNISLPDSCC